MAFEQKSNETNCFAKDGFAGFSGKINVDGVDYWITVFDNIGKQNGTPFRSVKLKKAQPAKAPSDDARKAANREATHYAGNGSQGGKRDGYASFPDDSEIPFGRVHDGAIA